MRVAHANRIVDKSGITATNQFKISTTAKNIMLMSKTLYSMPVVAVLRELSQNAYDSHKEAGISKVPIKVKLPNSISPNLVVQDFGVGMGHDFIMEMYTTYGESTKDQSDDYVGGLGYGSKTPLAVSDSFQVESVKDGIRNQYAIVVDEDGIPTINHLFSEPTTDGNGTIITVPIDSHQHHDFNRAAKDVYEFYPVLPDINLSLDTFTYNSTSNIKFKGDDYKVYEFRSYGGGHGPCRVIMETVAYPVNYSQLDLDNNELNFLRGMRIDIFMKVGTLDISPNREALYYDRATKKALSTFLKNIIQDIKNTFMEKFNKIDNEYFKKISISKEFCDFPLLKYVFANDHKDVKDVIEPKGTRYYNNSWNEYNSHRMPSYNGKTCRTTAAPESLNIFTFKYDYTIPYIIIDDVIKTHQRQTRIYKYIKSLDDKVPVYNHNVMVIRAEPYVVSSMTSDEELRKYIMDRVSKKLEVLGDGVEEYIRYLSDSEPVELKKYEYVAADRKPTVKLKDVRILSTNYPSLSDIDGLTTKRGIVSITEEYKVEGKLPSDHIIIPLFRGVPEDKVNVTRETLKFAMSKRAKVLFVPHTYKEHVPENHLTLVDFIKTHVEKIDVIALYLKRYGFFALSCNKMLNDIYRGTKNNQNFKPRWHRFLKDHPDHILSKGYNLKLTHDLGGGDSSYTSIIDLRNKYLGTKETDEKLFQDYKNEVEKTCDKLEISYGRYYITKMLADKLYYGGETYSIDRFFEMVYYEDRRL